jgi:hypothetical protein
MSAFKNVSGEDREVLIDGRPIHVAAGDSFTVPDEHDTSLESQPHFTIDRKYKPEPVAVPETEGDI